MNNYFLPKLGSSCFRLPNRSCLNSPDASFSRLLYHEESLLGFGTKTNKHREAAGVLPIVEKPLFLVYGNPRWLIVDFPLTQHACSRVVSPINESPAAAFELSLAICARLA